MAEQSGDTIQNAFDEIEKCLNEQPNVDINALKNSFKLLKLEHKIFKQANEIQIKDKENQIKDKEIQIQAKDYKILKLENQIKAKENETKSKETQETQEKDIQILKLQNQIKERETEVQAKDIEILELKNENKLLKSEKEIPMKAYIEMSINALVINGIEKFFLCSNEEEGVHFTYREWFKIMFERISKNIPFIFDKFVLVKVTCNDPTKEYRFYSDKQNDFSYNQRTDLNIFNKGWKHNTTRVFILNPNSIIKSVQMEKGNRSIDYHGWNIGHIQNESIGEDGFFVVLSLKK